MPNETAADTSRPSAGVSRRGLIAGAGAAVLATSLVGGAVPDAAASPTNRAGAEVGAPAAHPDGAPLPDSIASAPISGYVYRTACMYDFRPFNPASLPTWGGLGVYTAAVTGTLRATFELPAGVIVRDVEFYVSNGTAFDVGADLWQYAPGSGTISSLSVGAVIAPGSGVTATRAAVPASSAGPFPSGSRLLAGMSTPADGTVQLNGVRIGFSPGAGATALLPTPVRAYDSRVTGGAHSAGSTRTVTFPAGAVPAGASAVLANIAVLHATQSGYLKVYPANVSAPATSVLNYGTVSIANAAVLGVSNTRQVKVYTSQKVDVIIDITGFVS
jgi:hypothetical protein